MKISWGQAYRAEKVKSKGKGSEMGAERGGPWNKRDKVEDEARKVR